MHRGAVQTALMSVKNSPCLLLYHLHAWSIRQCCQLPSPLTNNRDCGSATSNEMGAYPGCDTLHVGINTRSLQKGELNHKPVMPAYSWYDSYSVLQLACMSRIHRMCMNLWPAFGNMFCWPEMIMVNTCAAPINQALEISL